MRSMTDDEVWAFLEQGHRPASWRPRRRMDEPRGAHLVRRRRPRDRLHDVVYDRQGRVRSGVDPRSPSASMIRRPPSPLRVHRGRVSPWSMISTSCAAGPRSSAVGRGAEVASLRRSERGARRTSRPHPTDKIISVSRWRPDGWLPPPRPADPAHQQPDEAPDIYSSLPGRLDLRPISPSVGGLLTAISPRRPDSSTGTTRLRAGDRDLRR